MIKLPKVDAPWHPAYWPKGLEIEVYSFLDDGTKCAIRTKHHHRKHTYVYLCNRTIGEDLKFFDTKFQALAYAALNEWKVIE